MSRPLPGEQELLRELEAVAREHLEWRGALAAETRLVEALGLDSLRLLTLVVEVENRFRIRLAEGEEAGIETAGELARLVRAKLLEQDGERAEPGSERAERDGGRTQPVAARAAPEAGGDDADAPTHGAPSARREERP